MLLVRKDTRCQIASQNGSVSQKISMQDDRKVRETK
jgi:hypothetical protein